MSGLNKIIKLEVDQADMRRSPSLVEDRLDELQAFAAVLIEAAQSSDMSTEYVDNITAQFMFALDSIVRFGNNAAGMVREERDLRRDALADRDSLLRQVTGLQALVEHLQTNRNGEIQAAVEKAVRNLAEVYGANADELLATVRGKASDD
jgi:hypothetical protein